jgi:hypothetical protein
MNLLSYIIFVTTIFIIYVEYNVGGILFRPNSLGKLSTNLYSLFSYLIDPLHNSFLWQPQLLDVNYIFVLGCSIILYCIIQ